MPKKKSTKSEAPESPGPPFEELLGRLEGIVGALEDGELGLDESLGRYEEGVKLLRLAQKQLKRAERRVELLSGVDAEGNPITEPLDDQATLDE